MPTRSSEPAPAGRSCGAAAALGLALAFGLAACVPRGHDQALQAQRALIGLPKETLLSCAGVPVRIATIEDREWFTYHSQNIHTTYTPGFVGRRPWAFGGGFDYDVAQTSTVSCQATFTLRGDRVERLEYTSPQGVAGNPQCAAIVANCLSLIPVSPLKSPIAPQAAPAPAPPPSR